MLKLVSRSINEPIMIFSESSGLLQIKNLHVDTVLFLGQKRNHIILTQKTLN
jgi:hypothetical protein